jgi:hypothetical protein
MSRLIELFASLGQDRRRTRSNNLLPGGGIAGVREATAAGVGRMANPDLKGVSAEVVLRRPLNRMEGA